MSLCFWFSLLLLWTGSDIVIFVSVLFHGSATKDLYNLDVVILVTVMLFCTLTAMDQFKSDVVTSQSYGQGPVHVGGEANVGPHAAGPVPGRAAGGRGPPTDQALHAEHHQARHDYDGNCVSCHCFRLPFCKTKCNPM